MNVVLWLSAMFILGIAVMGVCGLFVIVCEKI
jgi:hypothetical protein